MELPVVLLIEDDEDDLWTLEKSFSALDWPCQLMTFRDGESALTFLKNTSTPPALILLDQHMPGLTGTEVLAILRGLTGFQHTWVILMSGDIPSSFSAQVEGLGANGYLQKPSSMSKWQEELQQISRSLPH